MIRLLILANPSSGNGQASQVIERIRTDYPDLELIPFLTRAIDDEAYQVRQLLSDYRPQHDRILILGGDGTLSKLLKELPATIPFAYYPTGSGNDFARALAINNLDDVIAAILSNRQQEIGLMTYQGGVIVNSLDFGFAASVIAYTERSLLKKWLKKLGLGRLSYLIYAIKALFTPCSVTIDMQSAHHTLVLNDVFFISFANNRYFGGGIMIWPEASVFNGCLDVVYIENRGFYHNVKALLDLLCHRHHNSRSIHHLSAERLFLRTLSGSVAQVDGELISLVESDLVIQKRYFYR